MTTPTERLVEFAAAEHRLPDSVRTDTVRLIADTLIVGAAGRAGPGMAGVLAASQGWGAGDEARLIGQRTRLPAPSAAYVNCFAIHCLEWDAVHEGAVVHAMSAVVPAVMAAADRRGGTDPEAVIAAIAVGVDIACGLGLAADSGLTFFRPATAGIFGASAAAARIAGVQASAFVDVLGLAHAHAAGTMQAHSEGSIALPLQLANAARSALQVVDLVRHGLTGPRDMLEGPFGHFALFEQGDLSRYTRDLGNFWRICEVSTKLYPSGRASHACLGVLAEFHDQPVQAVEVRVPPLVRHLVGRPALAGMTPACARLCLPFLAALMLRDGQIDPSRFTPNTLADPHVLAVAAQITLVDDGNADPNALSPQVVIVTFADGRQETRNVADTLGAPRAPLTDAQVKGKRALARALAGPLGDPRLFDDPLAYVVDPL